MKKLKLESARGLIGWILVLGFFAAIFFSGSNLFAQEPDAEELYDVPRDELLGSYVTVNVDFIYGSYAYTETYKDNKPTGNITAREYLIDANEYDYMCMILKGDMMDLADELNEQSDEYYYGERDEITADFRVTGHVKALPLDSQKLLKEAVDYYNLSPEEQDTYLMYYIEPANYDVDPVFLVLALLCVGGILILLVLALSGHYQRQVRERLLQYFGTDTTRADQFLDYLVNLPNVKGLRVGAGYLLVRSGMHHKLLDGNDILWAYQQTTRQRYMGIIPVGKYYSLILMLTDGKQIAIPMGEKKVKEQLQILLQQFPTVAIGYSDQIQRIYNTNKADLRQVAAAQRGR